jgi:hypothetical protein
MVGDDYEVKVDGAWTPVPYDTINNVVAPDGGAHVCAPTRKFNPRKSLRPYKGIICADVSEFESYMPSHAVGSL